MYRARIIARFRDPVVMASEELIPQCAANPAAREERRPHAHRAGEDVPADLWPHHSLHRTPRLSSGAGTPGQPLGEYRSMVGNRAAGFFSEGFAGWPLAGMVEVGRAALAVVAAKTGRRTAVPRHRAESHRPLALDVAVVVRPPELDRLGDAFEVVNVP